MRYALALAAALILTAAACGDGNDSGLATTTIAVVADDGSRQELTVELARTPAERGRGLMFRDLLPEDRGMLFIFEQDTNIAFWMRNTTIPLSIAFITADGAILDIQDMEPLSMELHRPPGPYRYALEMNQGWFARHGFAPGDRVELPEEVAATGD